ncbi:MAG: sigma-E factor negative regulatory protein [Lysobacteraceae bacterium]
MTGPHAMPALDTDARNLLREQLSAMMDGELSPDETRFLLRRMQHDDALADSWAHWQYYGDAMRGECARALPADFSKRVGRAIADDIAQSAAQAELASRTSFGRLPLVRWGGGAALAASVALAAFLAGRMPTTTPAATTTVPPPVVTTSGGASTPVPPAQVALPHPAGTAPVGIPDDAAAGVTSLAAVAAATSARSARAHRMAAEQSLVTDRTPVAMSRQAPERPASVMVASADAAKPARDDLIVIKPWPRALVPGASGSGPLNADYAGAALDRHPVFLPQPMPPARVDPPLLAPAQAAADAP